MVPARWFAALTLTLFSSAVLAAPGDQLRPSPWAITHNQAVPSTWGPLKAGGGWTSLPPELLTVTVNGAVHPLCVTRGTQPFWAGLGASSVSGGQTQIDCAAFGNRSDGAIVFNKPSAVPAPMWLNTVAQFPEPRGAIVLYTQPTTLRKMFSCQFTKEGRTYVGYIGDDGNCYGAMTSGSRESASSYLTLVIKGTGPDAKPRYGWIDAGPGYTPHGPTVASATAAHQTHRICQGRPPTFSSATNANGPYWPGYVMPDGKCRYLSYVDNSVRLESTEVFQVYRADPSAPRIPWVFNRSGGKAVYACTSVATVNGVVTDTMFGFTTDPAVCTHGRATNNEQRPGYVWARPTIIALPDAEANAG